MAPRRQTLCTALPVGPGNPRTWLLRLRGLFLWGLLAGEAGMLGIAWQLDMPGLFSAMGGIFLITLIAARFTERTIIAQNLLHSLILLTLLVGLSDLARKRSRSAPAPFVLEDQPWSYEAASRDMQRFRQWWQYMGWEWNRFFRELRVQDPAGVLPFRLKPGAEVPFAESVIRINELGFRGSAFSREKPTGTFRILALGESTTMGVTLRAMDRPWPEHLAGHLQDALAPEQPHAIEIINAGIAAYRLQDNLARWESDLLPLGPDLVLSYHGYNSFEQLLTENIPAPAGLPHRRPRPSPTLESMEHALRLWNYRRRHRLPEPSPDMLAAMTRNAAASPFGRHYAELVQRTRDAGIPLVLIRYNMAIQPDSPRPIQDFYGETYLTAAFDIHANRIHTELLRELAHAHEHVFYVDASDLLDGHPRQFIDLVHLTESGRIQLARSLADWLIPWLSREGSVRRAPLP